MEWWMWFLIGTYGLWLIGGVALYVGVQWKGESLGERMATSAMWPVLAVLAVQLIDRAERIQHEIQQQKDLHARQVFIYAA